MKDVSILDTLSQSEPKEKSLHNFIDSHLREIRWTAYGLGIAACIVILKQTRAASKFSHNSTIPEEFINQHYSLQGVVKQVSSSGDLLVDHVPILQLRALSSRSVSEEYLCLRLAGLALEKEGVQWLKSEVTNRPVWFRLLQRDTECVECVIKRRKNPFWYSNVNKELVQLGLAVVPDYVTPPTTEAYTKLLHQLEAIEHKAAKKGRGRWKEEPRPSWLKEKGKGVAGWLKGLFRRKT